MKKIVIFVLALKVFLFCQVHAQPSTDNLVNASSLFSGSFMRVSPPSYVATNLMGAEIANYTPEALFDETKKLWCSRSNMQFPHVFEIELVEKFEIRALEFDNSCEVNYPGISSKDVKVEFATSILNPSFKQVGFFNLKEYTVNKFDIAPTDARIIRITILSNHGNSEFTELTDFKAFGVPKLKNINTIDVNGVWQSNWGNVTFNQTQSLFDGHYVFNDGIIRYGGMSRNQISFTWVENVIRRQGQTIMFLNEEGNRLIGVWCHDNDWNEFGFWILNRDKTTPFVPYAPSTTKMEYSVNKSVVKEMGTELQKNKKLTLYGINFNSNSSKILEESIPIIVQIASVLKDDTNMKIRIEGHTDDVGTDEYNKSLSQKRAEAVKAVLTDSYGISPNKIIVVGKGEDMPVADNITEIGKSANRRVEIHLVQ